VNRITRRGYPGIRVGAALALLVGSTSGFAAEAIAQSPPPPRPQQSGNIEVVAHLPLGERYSVADIEIEQDLHRPYVYVSRMLVHGFDIIEVDEGEGARVLYEWRIENADLHTGRGPTRGQYFKIGDRYYYLQGLQFGQGGPNRDLGAVVFEVTGLPDPSQVREVARIHAPDAPGGFHNTYAYKHSDGRVLMFVTSGPGAKVYDMEKLLAGDPDYGLIGVVPVAQTADMLSSGYHDFWVGFDPETQQDKFYGAGGGGYYVYDVTYPEAPEILVTVTDVPGFNWGHTFTPSPDGRYAIGEAEWQYQPLRVFDLKPGLDGEVENIDRAIGAWHADWRTVAHNHEVRWPYVFISGYEVGMYVVNMIDPTNPYTVGYFDTYRGGHNKGEFGDPWGPGNFTWGVYDGAFGVQVRNADGLIVISDMTTGFWALRMDGFQGWNGEDWGMPNVSSAQDWDNGPPGVRPRPISRSLPDAPEVGPQVAGRSPAPAPAGIR